LAALYQPPSKRRFWLKSGALSEKLGRRIPSAIAGGVFLVEVSKRVYPPKGKIKLSHRRRAIGAFEGIVEPVAKPI
jgi:hypothetical protein